MRLPREASTVDASLSGPLVGPHFGVCGISAVATRAPAVRDVSIMATFDDAAALDEIHQPITKWIGPRIPRCSGSIG
jgi:hypothetical protein